MAQFSIDNFSKQSPAWVIGVLSGITFICQGLPPLLGGYDVISVHTKEIVSLICDIINLFAAAIAPMVGKKETDKL